MGVATEMVKNLSTIRVLSLHQTGDRTGDLLETSKTVYVNGRAKEYNTKLKSLYEFDRSQYFNDTRADYMYLISEVGMLYWTTPAWPCDIQEYWSFITDEDDFGNNAAYIYTEKGKTVENLINNPTWEGINRSNIW